MTKRMYKNEMNLTEEQNKALRIASNRAFDFEMDKGYNPEAEEIVIKLYLQKHFDKKIIGYIPNFHNGNDVIKFEE